MELGRISTFSFGSEFCSKFISRKFEEIETFDKNQIEELFEFIEFERQDKKTERLKELNSFYYYHIEKRIIEEARKLDKIRNLADLNEYNQLQRLIPSQISEEKENGLLKEIQKIIIGKCSVEFTPILLIKGVIDNAQFEFVLKYFIDEETNLSHRISLLSKYDPKIQVELLKMYTDKYNFREGFILVEEFVKEEESLRYDFKLSEALFDVDFWTDKKSKKVVDLYCEFFESRGTDEIKYELFFEGLVKTVPQTLLYRNFQSLTNEECQKVFESLPKNANLIGEILSSKVVAERPLDFVWLYELANRYLDKESFLLFDLKVYGTIDSNEYFKYWQSGKGKTFPREYLEDFFCEKSDNYAKIYRCIENRITTNEEISDVLFSFLNKQVVVTDRRVFYKQLNHIKFLIQLSEENVQKIISFKNEFYNLILWVLDEIVAFEFKNLKHKFIYFEPDEQIRIIRKLFYYKVIGTFDLTIQKLDELTRFDLDLYKNTIELNGELPIDISTDIIIKALLSYKQNQRFFVESEIMTTVLNDLKLDRTKRFKLANYFEDCLGRTIGKFNWETEGEIKKVEYNEKFYFSISFPTGRKRSVAGGREVYERNPNFDHLKDTVKKLPEAKWNADELHWGVKAKYETEILKFAKEKRFFLDFEGSNYVNNPHLAEFIREDAPNGIVFCEGRLANIPDRLFGKEFWWCAGQPCFQKCESIHSSANWENYTLLDFCEILGFNTDEINKMGDRIPKGMYYHFISLINRFNRLLDRLYCVSCNHILFASDFGTGHFAAHTLVRFQCMNESCSNNDEIYLNHCLNGQCNCIIDSRVSKRCDNGLYICHNCGSCCSHKQFSTRLNNLLNNDKVDTTKKQWIINDLTNKLNKQSGHLERAEYFCYECKSEMKEISNDIFQCSNCNVKYDTIKYKFKRAHIHLRKARTTTNNKGGNEGNRNEDIDLPF